MEVRAMRLLFFSQLILCSLLSITGLAHAHSSGNSLEKESGDYLIDVGYSADSFVADETIYFNFELIDLKTQAPTTDYDSVRVIVARNKESYLAANIDRAVLGPTSLAYRFPDGGAYTFRVVYEQRDVGIAEALFDIEVTNSEGPKARGVGADFTFILISLGVGLVAGLTIQKFFFGRIK